MTIFTFPQVPGRHLQSLTFEGIDRSNPSIESLDWVEGIEFSIAFALLIDRLKVAAGHIMNRKLAVYCMKWKVIEFD
jgi:hypothetical protein